MTMPDGVDKARKMLEINRLWKLQSKLADGLRKLSNI